jgi:hypothetical protein
MQFAVQCASRPENRAISAYVSLEANAAEVQEKAEPFGWHKYLLENRHLHDVADLASPDLLAHALLDILTQPDDCPMRSRRPGTCRKARGGARHQHKKYAQPCVLVSSLTPRPLGKPDGDGSLFWTRCKQIEALLSAARVLRRRKLNGEKSLSYITHVLPLVVLDGLDMLTGAPLTREETHQLFQLFRRHETIGLLVAEASQESPFDSTMADVVITLAPQEEDNGYLLQHLEIEKSRYTQHVRGRHPFKTLPLRPEADSKNASLHTPPIPGKDLTSPLRRHGVVVYPSLHYVMLRTDYEPSGRVPRGVFAIGDGDVDRLGLPADLPRGSVVTIEGPRGTFKSALANTFLVSGLREGESVLLIRFNDQPYYEEGGRRPRLSTKVVAKRGRDAESFRWKYLQQLLDTEVGDSPNWANLASRHKVSISRWEYRPPGFVRLKERPVLFEIDFKGGALLPEEFIHIVREVMIRAPKVRRVAVQDVDMIGVSYPFLKRSSTTGDIFLAAFAHIMRNVRVDLLMTATRSGLAEANAMVDRAAILSDAVLSSEYCDIFGKREVVIRPKGVVGGQVGQPGSDPGGRPGRRHVMVGGQVGQPGSDPKTGTRLREVTPLLLRPDDAGDVPRFAVDTRCLDGFLGFGTGRIHRAGLSIFLFEENEGTHRRYNDEVESMVCASMAQPPRGLSRVRVPGTDTQEVSVLRFTSLYSEAVHNSLGILPADSPLDRTVVYTVDEFWKEDPNIRDRLRAPKPYYRNVLLLAYLRDKVSPGRWPAESGLRVGRRAEPHSFGSWQEVAAAVQTDSANLNQDGRRFWCDLSASETLSCVLMDSLASGMHLRRGTHDDCNIKGVFEPKVLSGRQIDEIEALCDLFAMMGPIDKKDKRVLPRDACLYVCWYSQLRELIARAPDLGERLDVAALPGGGFTGDWFIGTAKGSASLALGDIIVSKLSSSVEDYKRFAAGVGLPATPKFSAPTNKVFAWPRAQHVTLDRVMKDIHGQAWARSQIDGYPHFRAALSTICRHLTPLAGPPLDGQTEGRREKVRALVERVLLRVPMLKSAGSGDGGLLAQEE